MQVSATPLTNVAAPIFECLSKSLLPRIIIDQ